MNDETLQIILIIGANLTIFLTFMGIWVSLYLASRADIKAIHNEVKDFHNKLIEIQKLKIDTEKP